MLIAGKPPDLGELLKLVGNNNLVDLISKSREPDIQAIIQKANDKYFSWEEFRRRPMPGDSSPESMWLLVKMGRMSQPKLSSIQDKAGRPFTYWIPDKVFEVLNEIDRFSGFILTDDPSHIPDKEQYIISSLMEEAIASSQLEGAATTRRVAKEMLRTGRKPNNRSEKMILNNWNAIRYVRDNQKEPLTVDHLLQIHLILTHDLMDKPEESGQLRKRDDIEIAYNEETVHVPPPADSLPERVKALLKFANDDNASNWIHPVIKAIMIHFKIGYDHPFTDGNGRTARALMLWYILQKGYSLLEYVAISRYYIQSPGQYVRAYVNSEVDDNDMTYFISYNVRVINLAIQDTKQYLAKKQREIAIANKLLLKFRELNSRQHSLLQHALRHSGAIYNIEAYRNVHGVTYETARSDMTKLTTLGFLIKQKRGRLFVFLPAERMFNRLRSQTEK